MHFKSIEVKRFRQFRDAVAVHHLAPRLNVIAGSNETGKSTLLQAVRAALFDRYTSSVGEGFRPYGAAVSPEVGLVFDLGETEYRLTKVFSRRRDGAATLEAADGRRWEGPAAEDYLAELLGFSYAGRGGSRLELQGPAGLLWVEQATAYTPVTLTDESRRQVHGVFEHDMRELLGGDQGEALHRRISALWGECFDTRCKPRGDYRRLGEQEAELRGKLQAIEGELAAYEDKVDRLEQRQAELLAYGEDGTQEKAEARLRSARAAAERVTDLRAQVRAGAEQLGRTKAEWEAARQTWEGRARLIGECGEAREAERTAEQAVREKEVESARLNERLARLRDRLAESESRKRDLDAELRLAHDLEALERLVAEHARLDARFTEARAADAERRRCVAERDAIRVTEEAVAELRRIERTRDLAGSRLHAAATRIEHRLAPGAPVHLEEEPLAGDGSVRLTQGAELRISGIGRFLITPGGEDLDLLRREVEQADQRLAQGLAAVGAADVADAEVMLRRARELAGRAARHAATLEALAPEGLQALADQLSSDGARRDDLGRKLGDKAERKSETKSTEDLEQEVRTCHGRVSALEGDVRGEEGLIQGGRETLAGLRAEKTSAERLARRRVGELAQARVEAPDDGLREALKETERRVGVTSRNLETVTQALAAENPEVVESEVEQSRLARDDIRREIERLDREVRDLRTELRALGQKGLAEEVASVAADHAFAALQLEQAERRARALDLLQRTLDAALRRAKEAIAQPVMDRLAPYLRQLIPGAAPAVDEDLILTGIQRGETTEAFGNLSIGTREQLAVLIRLAYADLLSGAGVPVTLILDDALVNSDAERRERMKAILYQAAKGYQILLLTCHGREYRDTGGTFIRLEEHMDRPENGESTAGNRQSAGPEEDPT